MKIDGAADLRMHFRAAQLFLIDDLADGRFNQRWAGEIKTAPFGH